MDGKSFVVSGIVQELLYMVIMTIVYQILLFMFEYRIIDIRGWKSKFGRWVEQEVDEDYDEAEVNVDADVLEECRRVNSMVRSNDIEQTDALIVSNLCKRFGKMNAVSKLSFGVRYGECFGFLGINGAGKTTTFRMLTGEESLSRGNAFIVLDADGERRGFSWLARNRRSFLSNIGYCPQFDGVIDVLTGREMIQLFAHLRRIPAQSVDVETDKLLNKLGRAIIHDFVHEYPSLLVAS